MAVDKSKIVDVNFEVFWRQIGDAARMVELEPNKEFSVQVGNRKADISWAEWADDLSGVQIEVYEVEIKQEPLIVP